jgi:predicted glycoside hydrolase/deacetylase ChbG (UPF0249 family)
MVTAATAMVDTPFAVRALAEAPATLDLGLHVVLPPESGEGRVQEEIARQLDRFRALRGAAPTHLDSHRHAHARPGALLPFAEAALREGIPLRALEGGMRDTLRAWGVATADAFLGDAALRPCWTRERLLATLAALPGGAVELMCHPGHAPTHARTRFAVEREIELDALCDPAAHAALAMCGAVLGGFAAALRSPR